MAKLTVNQIAMHINRTAYTIKRWYAWYESLKPSELKEYINNGMPKLPKYELVGPTKWRYWEEKDIDQLIKFRDWLPNTRAGVMGSLNKKEDK